MCKIYANQDPVKKTFYTSILFIKKKKSFLDPVISVSDNFTHLSVGEMYCLEKKFM